jgi:hypothetical protein
MGQLLIKIRETRSSAAPASRLGSTPQPSRHTDSHLAHVRPLLLDAPLNLPTGWREAAAEHGLVLLFVGDRLGLGDHTEGHQTNPGKRALQAAERGELAAGAIAYPRPRRQLEPRPAHQIDPQPRSRANRWARTHRWQLRPTH